jgi:hypothetical protein
LCSANEILTGEEKDCVHKITHLYFVPFFIVGSHNIVWIYSSHYYKKSGARSVLNRYNLNMQSVWKNMVIKRSVLYVQAFKSLSVPDRCQIKCYHNVVEVRLIRKNPVKTTFSLGFVWWSGGELNFVFNFN